MQINKKITVLFIVFLAVIFLLPNAALAQDVWGANALVNTELGTKSIGDIVAGVINVALSFLGIIATGIILYGGFVWMTSQGNPDKIDKAKRIIVNGVIGLVIIASAYAIAKFLLDRFYESTVIGGPGGPGTYNTGTGLGAGVLESHYPARNATGIARNTNIYVTFREDMDTNFVINAGCGHVDLEYTDCVDDNFIQLYNVNTGAMIPGSDIMVAIDDPASPRVFEFNPYGNTVGQHLGSQNEEQLHEMVLVGLDTAAQVPAFLLGQYAWQFTVSTVIDETPPQVVEAYLIPADGDTVPMNSVVQITFSEAVNPIQATGVYINPGDFNNITVNSQVQGSPVRGAYLASNQYRTVEFITDFLCGQNSCGGDVYCLPPSDTLNGIITDTIEDMANNNLDGDYDGIAGGDYPTAPTTWQFGTTNAIDLSPPEINQMESGWDLPLDQPLDVLFSKTMLLSSIRSNTLAMYRNNPGDINFWFSFSTTNNTNDTVHIEHDPFEPLTNHSVSALSEIKDSLQNCWYPCRCDDPGGSCTCDTPGAICAGNSCEVW